MMIRAILLSLFLLFLLSPSLTALAWTGKVIGVADGDTIKVLHKNDAVIIKLYGIDTPEKRQAYSNKAKKYTNALVRRKRSNRGAYDHIDEIIKIGKPQGQEKTNSNDTLNREFVSIRMFLTWTKRCGMGRERI